MQFTDKARFDTLRSIAAGSIGMGFTAVGTALISPAIAVSFKNDTNGDVIVSDNGTDDKLIFPPNSYGVWDIRTNAPNTSNTLYPEGTQFSVAAGTAIPSTGNFYIEVLTVVIHV